MRNFIKASGIVLLVILIIVALTAAVCVVALRMRDRSSATPLPTEAPTPVVLQVEPPATTYAASNLYAKMGQVVGLDVWADLVRFVDSRGMKWEFYGVEDWAEGDLLCAIFYDGKTLDPYDDQVIATIYTASDY